jgi:hypothetical protein
VPTKKDRPPIADWEVHTSSGSTIVIAASWWQRDKRGAYTFHTEQGVTYDFGPSAVEYVHIETGPCTTLKGAVALPERIRQIALKDHGRG